MPVPITPGGKYSRKILPAAHSLVTDGKFNFGTFDGPFTLINPLDASRVFGFPVPRFLKYLRLKEWQAFQLGNADFFMLAVVYNQKGVCLIQFILYDKKGREGMKYQRFVPSWKAGVASSLDNTRTRYLAKDFSIDIHNKLQEGRIFIDVALSPCGDLPEVYGHFEAFHDPAAVRPLVVCLPFAKNRGMYSHKCLMPMEGVLYSGERRIVFARQSSFAIMDDHKGYYPYALEYDWVTGVGPVAGRGLTGFNLTDNQVIDKERYNENCVWTGRELHLLPPVTVSRPGGIMKDWLIRDNYGMVNLVFTPAMDNAIKLNLLLAKTDYHGPFGSFNGFLRLSSGDKIPVKNFFGMGEKKYLMG